MIRYLALFVFSFITIQQIDGQSNSSIVYGDSLLNVTGQMISKSGINYLEIIVKRKGECPVLLMNKHTEVWKIGNRDSMLIDFSFLYVDHWDDSYSLVSKLKSTEKFTVKIPFGIKKYTLFLVFAKFNELVHLKKSRWKGRTLYYIPNSSKTNEIHKVVINGLVE